MQYDAEVNSLRVHQEHSHAALTSQTTNKACIGRCHAVATLWKNNSDQRLAFREAGVFRIHGSPIEGTSEIPRVIIALSYRGI